VHLGVAVLAGLEESNQSINKQRFVGQQALFLNRNNETTKGGDDKKSKRCTAARARASNKKNRGNNSSRARTFEVEVSMTLQGWPFMTQCMFFLMALHCMGKVSEAFDMVIEWVRRTTATARNNRNNNDDDDGGARLGTQQTAAD